MRKLQIILFLFLGMASVFAATPLKFSKSCLMKPLDSRQEIRHPFIEKTRSLIPNSVFSRALAKGTRWGAYGAVLGAGAGLLAHDEMGIVPVFLSILGGSAGFATGFSWGVLNKNSRKALRRNPPKNYRIAFNMEVNSGMVDYVPMNDPSFGIVLRWPGNQKWISKPNYVRAYYGRLVAGNNAKTKPATASITDKRFGVEVLKIRRDHIIHFFYGLGAGYSSGTYTKRDVYEHISSSHPESSAFIDFIFGVNLNVTDFAQAQLVYKWEPLGIRNRVDAADNFNPGINHLIGFSFIVFFF